ncbi:plastocyanin/azurin family copper-binding protein [Halosimplex sp. J119]
MNRRHVLRAGAAGLAAAIAGCGEGDGTETEAPQDGGGGQSTPTASAPPADGSETTAPPAETSEPEPTPAGDTGTPTPEATPTATTSPTATAAPTATATATPRDAAQVVAVADGALAFAPDSFEISTGETVVWVWHSNGHNVRPASTPSNSEFSGTEGGEDTLYDEGHTLSHTFEVAGEYEYYCDPHRSAGMTGSFTVTE